MSRCFPFPPPGYEKRAGPDDADLLKKEQQREKKHKKERRDKEKKEGKEKRERDRSDGKHRERKERKEKHRDKKKDKEKDGDKNKEKSRTSEEKGVTRQFEGYNGEKLHQKEQGKPSSSTSVAKRVSGQFEGCNGEKFHKKEERAKDKFSSSDEKKPAVQFQGHNGEKPIRNSLVVEETEDAKFVVELGRRIREEENGTRGSQLVVGFTGTDQKMDEGIQRFALRDNGMLPEGKEKSEDKRVDNSKMDEPRLRDEARFSGNAMVQNLTGVAQNNVEGMPRPMEKKIERKVEGKEKSKERGGDDKQGDRHKNKDREKKRQGKDKDGEKEKKKEEKAKGKSENKKPEKDRINHSSKNDLIGAFNNKMPHLSKDCDKIAATERNLKKRKVDETNGFLHDNERRLYKMPRPASHTENGKKVEPYQAPSLSTSDGHGSANNLKVDNNERKVNVVIAVQPMSVSTTKPSASIADQVAEASTKLPHPDTKYLGRILSVPEMEEWSDFDDQEWLFSCRESPSKKSEVGSVGANEELRVWAEALQIESADVCALPYVIPY